MAKVRRVPKETVEAERQRAAKLTHQEGGAMHERRNITVGWRDAVNDPPPEMVVVETISEHGNPALLYREGNLWFVADGSMYVYYVPKSWREQG